MEESTKNTQFNTKTVSSSVKNAKISPRKLNLVANLVRETMAKDAVNQLRFAQKKGAPILASLIKSAMASAESNLKVSSDSLYISTINVGPGTTIKAGRIKAKGTVHRIRKRSTNIKVILESVEEVKSETKKDKKVEKKSVDSNLNKKEKK